VINAGETTELLRLSLREEVATSRSYWPLHTTTGRNLKTHLTLMTNLTNVKIPLLVFDGKLKPVSFFCVEELL
jgi:hypothetical protein